MKLISLWIPRIAFHQGPWRPYYGGLDLTGTSAPQSTGLGCFATWVGNVGTHCALIEDDHRLVGSGYRGLHP